MKTLMKTHTIDLEINGLCICFQSINASVIIK